MKTASGTSEANMESPLSAGAAGAARLAGLATGLGLGDRSGVCVDTFRAMTYSWGAATAGELPESDVSSDGSPVEFAVGFDDDPSLQFAVEALRPGDCPVDRVVSARATMARLVRRYGADERRWAQVADLYLPEKPATEHVAMFGAEVRQHGDAQFKVWFYPAVGGPEQAAELCERGLAAVGLGAAWDAVAAHMPRGERLDRPVMFSLDLSAAPEARVKLYFRHYATDAGRLAELMASYPGFGAGPVREFCQVMAPEAAADLSAQPPVTCLSFTGARPAAVGGATVYLPMWTYAPDDEVVRRRMNDALAACGRASAPYERALREVASRPLGTGRGIHNYVAWRPGPGRPRLKAYFSPELRHADPAARYALDGQG
ncbi:tryptophan dimethylallyltransferase family protein [Streptomyces atratus]|uniref:Aromatic prenyltransferase n=1 Tax=Streptomyces atratus TaxID=1893 RepID=A0A8E4MST2_STRAR|nr:tryptophan dimethylallyltransferase family protein [Streptomyces atratus]QLF98927.1 aromatic prenyltransferase [Streptomyces atratus]WPW27214.1 tryptophan dimethylallyltransferase family protein [Streptomyces atratus]